MDKRNTARRGQNGCGRLPEHRSAGVAFFRGRPPESQNPKSAPASPRSTEHRNTEKILVREGAPTLAGLKTASIFTVRYSSLPALVRYVRSFNRRVGSRGLSLVLLRAAGDRALLYLYRPARLRRDLTRAGARRLLSALGYPAAPRACLYRLMERLGGRNFPHEIGLFLGYPPEDVRGFMEHGARGYKTSGIWKVYGNPARAEEMFRRYRKCTRVYTRKWAQGMPLERLAVPGFAADPRENGRLCKKMGGSS